MVDQSNFLIVAALHFGNTQSGVCFSFSSEFKSDPRKIHSNSYWNCGKSSLKTPTCVLLDKDKELNSFGYEAENTYSELCMDEKQDEYYFFRGFFNEKVCPLSKISIYYIRPICSSLL